MLCVTKTTEYMKKFLKAIGCFAIFVLAVFSYFREQPYKLDSLSLQNVEALAESMDDNTKLVLSSSNDVVDHLNFVEDEEREIFFEVLNQNNIDYNYFDNLCDCLKDTYKCADANDIILLIGAQGMDPAEGLLENILRK